MDTAILISAFQQAFTPLSLGLLLAGALWGTIIGALPGLGAIMAITILLPITYTMPSVSALGLLMGAYCGAIYGGSITAVLQNIPGTAACAATCFDGYPLARQGKAGEALGWATMASIYGGLFSCVVLIFAAPLLAAVSIYFGPIEIFAVITLALICIAGVSQEGLAKGLMAGFIGLFLGTIGIDPIAANTRFTFGIFQLSGGVDLLSLFIGLFALTEVLSRVFETSEQSTRVIKYDRMIVPSLKDWRGPERLKTLFKANILGTVMGILPGTGAAAAAFVAYSEARRTSSLKDNFGKGEVCGIIAPEAANNAVTGGALVPTLALGIPGDSLTAVMMGTLVIHGLTPGVGLMRDNPDIVMGTFILLFLANLLFLPVGMLVARVYSKIIRLPEPLVLSGVTLLCVLGVYTASNNAFSLQFSFICAIIGFIMRLLQVPVAPLVIGFVLSTQFEISLRQALIITNDNPLLFLKSPIAVFFFIVIILLLLRPVIHMIQKRQKGTPEVTQSNSRA